ncbi:MAG: hypothetical protein QGG42_12430 [Phycisphaerae bacterium]|jgi:hypothetical protein|nr:hypothetical protein [Phycisphaerae bacterium]
MNDPADRRLVLLTVFVSILMLPGSAGPILAQGKTFIRLKRDHGLRIEGAQATEVFSMWRTYEGREKFTVRTAAAPPDANK